MEDIACIYRIIFIAVEECVLSNKSDDSNCIVDSKGSDREVIGQKLGG